MQVTARSTFWEQQRFTKGEFVAPPPVVVATRRGGRGRGRGRGRANPGVRVEPALVKGRVKSVTPTSADIIELRSLHGTK